METIYVETTVIGHLTARRHSDPLIAARQETTRRWWVTASSKYRLLVSQLVIDECAAGDPIAAKERLAAINNLPLLEFTDDVTNLGDELTLANAVPISEPRDAFHIALAAVHGVQYLVTWNFKHIANATRRGQIEAVCRDAGFGPPIICTPDELENADIAD